MKATFLMPLGNSERFSQLSSSPLNLLLNLSIELSPFFLFLIFSEVLVDDIFLIGEKYQEKSTHLVDLNQISGMIVVLCCLDHRNSDVWKPQSSPVSESAVVDKKALKNNI